MFMRLIILSRRVSLGVYSRIVVKVDLGMVWVGKEYVELLECIFVCLICFMILLMIMLFFMLYRVL